MGMGKEGWVWIGKDGYGQGRVGVDREEHVWKRKNMWTGKGRYGQGRTGINSNRWEMTVWGRERSVI